ncbi:hypothetical protein BIZ78_gp104 [Erwinia phage vB_EamM_Caitlin]|uniref:hypothetical protein n=1 Tax=Erwinia phage vB_EamM_Caitlin TaxID=1883379 RepID=UPI00081C62F9|nr:hypothetical protein BIZ78_gp104 [Erwinia phage vB_EamM_Caitlin]ANZ48471.1 hypothetical protein CAITLIN_176 [Erwinia phage vB_EamM_Caitlin]
MFSPTALNSQNSHRNRSHRNPNNRYIYPSTNRNNYRNNPSNLNNLLNNRPYTRQYRSRYTSPNNWYTKRNSH